MKTKILRDSLGKRRKCVYIKCDKCGKYNWKPIRTLKFKKHYCSTKCQLGHTTNKVEVKCANCGNAFEQSLSRIKRSKSGLMFCSKKCLGIARRKENAIIKVKGNGLATYRSLAFRYYEHKCEICGYDDCIDILQVHHIDGNRNNNKKENLIIMCPNCHAKVTRKVKRLVGRKMI